MVVLRFGTLRQYHAVEHSGCARSAGLGRFGDATQDDAWQVKGIQCQATCFRISLLFLQFSVRRDGFGSDLGGAVSHLAHIKLLVVIWVGHLEHHTARSDTPCIVYFEREMYHPTHAFRQTLHPLTPMFVLS